MDDLQDYDERMIEMINAERAARGILHPDYRYVATGSVEVGNYVYNTQRFTRACS